MRETEIDGRREKKRDIYTYGERERQRDKKGAGVGEMYVDQERERHDETQDSDDAKWRTGSEKKDRS